MSKRSTMYSEEGCYTMSALKISFLPYKKDQGKKYVPHSLVTLTQKSEK